MQIVLEIPVKRYVLNYIENKYGSPWIISKRFKEGRMLINLLNRAPNRYEKYRSSDSLLKIKLLTDTINDQGCYLTPKNIDEFCEFIKQCILDDIVNYSLFIKGGIGLKNAERVDIKLREDHVSPRKAPTREGIKFFSQKEIIFDILSHYGIDESDMTYDSIAKHLQRLPQHKF